MEKTPREIFERYINKVCKDKKTREYAMSYYDDFCKYYRGKLFTRDDFEKIIVNGQEVEQDGVEELFNGKTTATPEEVMMTFFQTRVKKIKVADANKGITGYYDPKGKQIVLSRNEPNTLVGVYNTKNWKTMKRNKDPRVQEAYELRDKKEKHTMYHEMSHVTETSVYEGGKACKTGNYIIHENYGYTTGNEINHDNTLTHNSDFTEMVDTYGVKGQIAFSEILNEQYSQKIEGSYKIVKPNEKTPSWHYKTQGYQSNLVLENYNDDYCSNMGFLRMVCIALGVENIDDLRSKPGEIYNLINKIVLSDDAIKAAIGQFDSQLLRVLKQGDSNYSQLANECTAENVASHFPKGTADILFTMLGVKDCTNTFSDKKPEGVVSNVNSNMQSLLINGIKNRYMKEFSDPSIVKDQAYFARLNEELKEIAGFLIVPIASKIMYKRNSETRQSEPICYNEADIYSARRLAEEHPEDLNLKEWADLLEWVAEMQKNAEYSEYKLDILEEDSEKERKYKELENEDNESREEEQIVVDSKSVKNKYNNQAER